MYIVLKVVAGLNILTVTIRPWVKCQWWIAHHSGLFVFQAVELSLDRLCWIGNNFGMKRGLLASCPRIELEGVRRWKRRAMPAPLFIPAEFAGYVALPTNFHFWWLRHWFLLGLRVFCTNIRWFYSLECWFMNTPRLEVAEIDEFFCIINILLNLLRIFIHICIY